MPHHDVVEPVGPDDGPAPVVLARDAVLVLDVQLQPVPWTNNTERLFHRTVEVKESLLFPPEELAGLHEDVPGDVEDVVVVGDDLHELAPGQDVPHVPVHRFIPALKLQGYSIEKNIHVL